MSCQVSTFASAAEASSYWSSSDGFHVDNVLGAPTRPGVCADAPGAWSPAAGGSDAEWLRVEFPSPLYAERIELWETYAAPFVSAVAFEDTAGARHAPPERVLAPQRALASIGPVVLV